MYREIEKNQAAALAESVEMRFTIKSGWEGSVTALWSAIPCLIIGVIGAAEQQLLFDCYRSSYDGNMDVSRIKPSDWLNKQEKGLIDFYLKMALKTLLNHAESNLIDRLLISTDIPSAFEHLVDLGFTLTPKNHYSPSTAQGYIDLRR